jgi:hypothetical protein
MPTSFKLFNTIALPKLDEYSTETPRAGRERGWRTYFHLKDELYNRSCRMPSGSMRGFMSINFQYWTLILSIGHHIAGDVYA